MGKGAGSVSIIGGADGPTSIFVAGKGGKVKLTTRIQNYFRKLKRNRIKKRIKGCSNIIWCAWQKRIFTTRLFLGGSPGWLVSLLFSVV